MGIVEEVMGPESLRRATCLDGLAQIYVYRKDYQQAEDYYRRAMALREHGLGADHPTTISSAGGLAHLYWTTNRLAEAGRSFFANCQSRRNQGPDYPSTALALNNLGAYYNYQGRYGAAEPLFFRLCNL